MPSPPLPRPDLQGRVAVVTGASRGIGRALALTLAESGCAVTVAARSERGSPERPGCVHDTAREIEARGGRALALRVDVCAAEQIEAMVERTVAHFGRLDYIVHNAGVLWWRPVAETPIRHFDLLTRINVRAGFLCAHHALPHMRRLGGGRFVFVAPPLDLEVLPGKTAWMVSKYGLTLLARGLAAEEAEHGIGACALWPATAVESWATIQHQVGHREQWRRPEIVADALLEILRRPAARWNGRGVTDEEVLRCAGVEDFHCYDCVPRG